MSLSLLKNHHAQYSIVTLVTLIFITSISAFAANPPTPLTWQNLKDDAALGKQISLEAKHLPLGDLLAQVSGQSGVTLSLSSNSPLAQKLVTARISQMNLYDFMGAIGRTYNANWSKTGQNQFILTEKPANAIEEGISQMGMPRFYRYRDLYSPDTRNDLYQKVLLAAGLQALESKKGVSVQTLPTELVDSLKGHYMQVQSVELLLKYSAFKSLSDQNIIRITIKQDTSLDRDPVVQAYIGVPDPLDDKVMTLEVLMPDKTEVMGNNLLSWQFLGRDVEQRLKEQQQAK